MHGMLSRPRDCCERADASTPPFTLGTVASDERVFFFRGERRLIHVCRNDGLEKVLQPRLHALRETIHSGRAQREAPSTHTRPAERETNRRVLRKACYG